MRIDGIKQLEKQEAKRAELPNSPQKDAILAAWTEIGPNPIPNGQVQSGAQLAVSGRTIAIAVHPTDPNIVYVGTAQGGLYRTTDGGTTWTPLLDNALSLAIGAIAISPSSPDTVYVGTGETGFTCSSYFGVGLYRITNASTASPTVSGPFGGTEMSGRAVSEIVVDPANAANIFATTTSGIGGIGCQNGTLFPSKGLYRSTDALNVTPTFTKLTVATAGENLDMVDLAIDPANGNRLLVSVIGSAAQSGVWLSTTALGAATFTRQLTMAGTTSSTARTELTINNVAGVVTAFAASANAGGRVSRSIDGGSTWTTQITNSFCGGQCFYNIAIAVDPTNASNVYLGGTATTTTFGRSTNGGTSFTNSQDGLHTDSHAIAVAPSLPSTIYFGSDGGIYKSTDSGVTWATLNNTTFRATQFMSIAVHPIDPNFTIGGTQDNGTEYYNPSAVWTRADFGDGGYSLIDQSSLNNVAVNMYHTYFNASTLQGYGFVTGPATATEGSWVFRGCNGVAGNGIPCFGAVLFYAPIEQGPGTPNTIYYGANILYRSSNTGLNHTAVSQDLTNPISAIGISPQNDNVRIVGTNIGQVFGTTTGANPLTNMDPTNVIPNNYVGRTVVDPNNVNTAYVTLAAFGVTNVWKTTTLSSFADNISPTWTAANSGLPAVPVNAFVVDPLNSNNIYAGTDIGVYFSTNGGTSWLPLGSGLPRVAVFDMAVTSASLLRIATHGRGMWQISIAPPLAANVSISGRVLTSSGRAISRVRLKLTNSAGQSREITSSSFGYFTFEDVPVGETYTIEANHKRYSFTPQVVNVNDNIEDLNFVAQP